MKLTRLTFEVRVPEDALAAFYARAKANGIPDPSVRLDRAVTAAVAAAISTVGLPAMQDEDLEHVGSL